MNRMVMIIDDDADLVRLTEVRLKHAGYQVCSASGSGSLLETIESKNPGLILMDVHLSGINGFDLCKAIKTNPKTKDIPLLFFTASTTNAELDEKIKECPAEGYIQKPFTQETLIGSIKKYIQS